MKKTVVLLLFLFNEVAVWGQTYPFIHYTTKDGLSNNTVFSMVQDHDGFMWLGTSNGLNRFDGYSFKSYFKGDGMYSNSVSSLFIDSAGVLWISNGHDGFAQWKNNKLELLKLNDKFLTHTNNFTVVRDTLYFVDYDWSINVLDLKRNSSFTVDSITGSETRFKPYCLLLRRSPKSFGHTSNDELLIGSSTGLIKKESGRYIKADIKGLGNVPVYSLYEGHDNTLYAGSLGKIFKIKNSEVIGEIKVDKVAGSILPVSRLLVDRYNVVWFSMIGYNDFFYYSPRHENRIVPLRARIGLDKSVVNAMTEDREGNVWISIFGKGVYCFYNFFLENFRKEDGLENSLITSIAQTKRQNILVGTNDGLYVYSEKHNSPQAEGGFSRLSFLPKTLEYIKYLNPTASDRLYVCMVTVSSGYFHGTVHKKFPEHLIDAYCIFANSISPLMKPALPNKSGRAEPDSLALGMWDNTLSFGHLVNDEIRTSSCILLYPKIGRGLYVRVNKIEKDYDGNFLIATNKGLVIIPKDAHGDWCDVTDEREYNLFLKNSHSASTTYSRNRYPKDFDGSAVINIVKDREGKIWVESDEKLGYVSSSSSSSNNSPGRNLLHDTTWTFIKHAGIYPIEHFTALTFDNKNRMWVGTPSGLYMVEPSSHGEKARLFNIQDGLPSAEINSLYYDEFKNFLWIGTVEGLSRIDLNFLEQFDNQKSSVRLFTAITPDATYYTNDNRKKQPVDQSDFPSIKLAYNKSALSLKYVVNSLNAQNKLTLQYNVDEKGWRPLSMPEINFNSPKRGKHTVVVRSVNHSGEYGNVSTFTFTVNPPWYDTWLFRSVLLAAFLIGVWWVAKKRNDRVRRKTHEQIELNQKINMLQHQALSAQMNPHFIFNSLNSLQYFINAGQKEQANEYLAKLATLIRSNLEHSDHVFIPGKVAMQRMESYIQLQQMRFEEKIDFSIFVEEKIDVNKTEIPNFIAQPFVENAIWHGFENSIKDKKLKIECTTSGDNLIIRIIDNGVGITRAAANKRPDHISKGINIVCERLRLLALQGIYKNGEYLSYKNRNGIISKMEFIQIRENQEDSEFSSGTEVIITLTPDMYRIVK